MKLSRVLLIGSFLSFITAFVMVSYPVAALIWNVTFPETSAALAQKLSKPVTTSETQELQPQSEFVLPEKDLSLPEETIVKIPKIGVETQILEASHEEYESALKLGVWRVPDFGIPTEAGPPIILVAHRFGYLNWSQPFREKNSFFNLPELQAGDTVEIIWDQRKFVYEIYHGEDGTEITHYTADLILYTCRFLESDIRIFRYAKLVAP